MTELDYRAVLDAVPDLAAQFAGAVIPSSQMQDLPIRGSERPEAARIVALDDLEQLMRELVDSIDFWQKAFQEDSIGQLPAVALDGSGVARTEFGIRYTRVITTDPLQSARDARAFTDILLGWWDEIEGHYLWEWWLTSLDEWLVPAVRKLEVRQVRQRARRCGVCGALDVWADLEHASAVCAMCGEMVREEVWMSVKAAAAQLEVDVATVRRWVAGDKVEHRRSGRTNQVELASCRDYQAERRAAAILRLSNARSVG